MPDVLVSAPRLRELSRLMRLCQRLGRLLTLGAAAWVVLDAATAIARERVRVWLVAATAGTEDEALGRRLTAELAGQGFAVARASSGTGHDQMLRLLSPEIPAAIWVDARARRTEVWMVRPGGPEGRLEQVIAAEAPGSAGVLALRTVEFLRARLGAPAAGVDERSMAEGARAEVPDRAAPARSAPSGLGTTELDAPEPGPPEPGPPEPAKPQAPSESGGRDVVEGLSQGGRQEAMRPVPTVTDRPRLGSRATEASSAQPRPSAVDGPTPPNVAPEESGAPSPRANPSPAVVSGQRPAPVVVPRHGTFALGVGVLATSGSLGPWPGVGARFAALVPARLFVAVSAFASWRKATAEGDEGNASVAAFAGSVSLGRLWVWRGFARFDCAFGLRLLGLSASGRAAAPEPFVTPYVATTDFVVGLGAEAEVGLDVPIVGPLSLRTAVEVGWLFRRPVLTFDTREVAAVGRTMIAGTVGLQAAF